MFYSFNSGGTMYDLKVLHWIGIKSYSEIQTLNHCVKYGYYCFIIGCHFNDYWSDRALEFVYVKRERRKIHYLSFNNVLIVSPDVIIGASFLILFTMVGIKLGFTSVLLSHIAFSVPIVVIMVLPKLQEMSPTLIDAARDLGASRWDVLTKVIFHILHQVFLLDFLWH